MRVHAAVTSVMPELREPGHCSCHWRSHLRNARHLPVSWNTLRASSERSKRRVVPGAPLRLVRARVSLLPDPRGPEIELRGEGVVRRAAKREIRRGVRATPSERHEMMELECLFLSSHPRSLHPRTSSSRRPRRARFTMHDEVEAVSSRVRRVSRAIECTMRGFATRLGARRQVGHGSRQENTTLKYDS